MTQAAVKPMIEKSAVLTGSSSGAGELLRVHKVSRQQGWLDTNDDSFQAQAKRLGVIGHPPSHAPECLILGVVRKRHLSPGACAFHVPVGLLTNELLSI